MAESVASLKATVKIPGPPPQPDLPLANSNKLPSVKKIPPPNSLTNGDVKNGEVKNGDTSAYVSPTLTNINGDSEPMIVDQSPTVTAPIYHNSTSNINNHSMATNSDHRDDSQKTIIALEHSTTAMLPHEMSDAAFGVKKKDVTPKTTDKMNAPSTGLSYGSIDNSSKSNNECKCCRVGRGKR